MKKSKLTELLETLYVKHGNKNITESYKSQIVQIVKEEIARVSTILKRKDVTEEAKRDYKDEYKKFQSSDKSKKYRAELNKYNRDNNTYGNGDGKDASHKGGKIVGFESEAKNRGRKEKSRLKKKK